MLTLSNMSSYFVTRIFSAIGVPAGYFNFSLMVLALPFLCVIVANKKEKIIKPFWTVAKYWLPWLVYLSISGALSPEGIWKLKMYLGIMVLPCMLLVIIALVNPTIFQRYFMKVLLYLNIVLVIIYSLGLVEVRHFEGAEGIERMLWLSRGIGISIAYFIITSSWRRHPVVTVPLIALLFGIMLFIGARGPVISLIVTLGIFLVIRNRKNMVTTFLLSAATIVVLVAFMSFSYLSDFARSFATHGETRKITRIGEDRLSAYGPTLNIFADHPVFGVGLGKWWAAYQKESRLPEWVKEQAIIKRIKKQIDMPYPHNIFLEILSELGIIGMVFFIMLFIPFKRLFILSNEYNFLCLLGFLYAWTSSDITQNSAPMIFNLLSILRAKGYLPPLLSSQQQRNQSQTALSPTAVMIGQRQTGFHETL